MIIKIIIPKLGDSMHYLGKPVFDEFGVRIGSIVDIKDVDEHYEAYIEVDLDI